MFRHLIKRSFIIAYTLFAFEDVWMYRRRVWTFEILFRSRSHLVPSCPLFKYMAPMTNVPMTTNTQYTLIQLTEYIGTERRGQHVATFPRNIPQSWQTDLLSSVWMLHCCRLVDYWVRKLNARWENVERGACICGSMLRLIFMLDLL